MFLVDTLYIWFDINEDILLSIENTLANLDRQFGEEEDYEDDDYDEDYDEDYDDDDLLMDEELDEETARMYVKELMDQNICFEMCRIYDDAPDGIEIDYEDFVEKYKTPWDSYWKLTK